MQGFGKGRFSFVYNGSALSFSEVLNRPDPRTGYLDSAGKFCPIDDEYALLFGAYFSSGWSGSCILGHSDGSSFFDWFLLKVEGSQLILSSIKFPEKTTLRHLLLCGKIVESPSLVREFCEEHHSFLVRPASAIESLSAFGALATGLFQQEDRKSVV